MTLTTALTLLSLFTIGFSISSKDAEFRLLQTRQGAINGTRDHARNGKTFYSFKGIPFAKPPIGTLRFKDPEAASAWSGVRNGSWTAPECIQTEIFALYFNSTKDEDCLYLNVFTPLTESSAAVMVYIHGGGFSNGGMALYQPHLLLTQDVVLVNIQYRLGFLGFLSTEDDVAPGNLGLKDQTQALRWVKNNIQEYGGDPNRVTVFGESSGGRAAHLQMLTPSSRGLFSHVILQSGTATVPATTQHGGFREDAVKLGSLFNCSTQGESETFNSTDLISCLQQLPVSSFVQPKGFEGKTIFGIRVDGNYMPASPEQLIKMGDYHNCDIMAGFTEHEGATIVLLHHLNNQPEEIIKYVHFDFGEIFNLKPDDPAVGELVLQALRYYTGSPSLNISQVTQEHYDQVVRLLTSTISLSHDQAIQLHARDTLYDKKVFAYELKYRGEQTLILKHLFPHLDDKATTVGKNWVNHGDDLLYLFSIDIGNWTMTRPDDIKMSEVMVKLWTNFATHGDPTPDDSLGFKWSPVSLLSQRQQLVLKPEPYMEVNDRCKDLEFWQSLPRSEAFIITEQKCSRHVMCLLQ